MAAEIVLPAPAKLNLFLHITGRRPDGYHELQTLFQLLDYGDELHFSLRNDHQLNLTCSVPALETTDNLVLRAARLLQELTGCPSGADIHLTKNLPMGGGVGGGSSDAATTLIGLNHLWQTGLNRDQLAELGLRLGADVPVFILGNTAWAEGIGEQLTPVALDEAWYLVLSPACEVSTAEIFAHRELTRNAPPITIRAFLERGGENSCQAVVEGLYPAISEALNWLRKQGSAQMTGTGGCVFSRFETQAEAEAVLSRKPGSLMGFVARGINHSPLCRQIP